MQVLFFCIQPWVFSFLTFIYSGELSLNFSRSLCFLRITFCFQCLYPEYRTVQFTNNSTLSNLHFVYIIIITLTNLNYFQYPTGTIRLCSKANQNHLLQDLLLFSVCCDKWKQIARWWKALGWVIFFKKIPLSRRVGCYGRVVQWISERCMYVTPIRLDLLFNTNPISCYKGKWYVRRFDPDTVENGHIYFSAKEEEVFIYWVYLTFSVS